MDFVVSRDEGQMDRVAFSWIEVAFWVARFGDGLAFPTIASWAHFVKQAVTTTLESQGAKSWLRTGLDCTEIGISFPVDGVLVGVPSAEVAVVRKDILDLTSVRSFRRVADLARAMPRPRG